MAIACRETISRLVDMTNQTNLVALDKALAAIRHGNRRGYYAVGAARVGCIGERIVRAAFEVRQVVESI